MVSGDFKCSGKSTAIPNFAGTGGSRGLDARTTTTMVTRLVARSSTH